MHPLKSLGSSAMRTMNAKVKKIPYREPDAARKPITEEVIIRLSAPKSHLMNGTLQSSNATFNGRDLTVKFERNAQGNYVIQLDVGLHPGNLMGVKEFQVKLSIYGPGDNIIVQQGVELQKMLGVIRATCDVQHSALVNFADDAVITVEAKIIHVKEYLR